MYFHRSLPSLCAAVLLAATPAVLRAQLPAPPPGDAPTIPGTPNRPVVPFPGNGYNPRAISSAPSGIPGPIVGEENVRLYYPNLDVKDVLDHYAVLTGKRVLPDNTVQGTLDIRINTPVPKAEAIRIIEVALNLNGFTLVQVDDSIIKVLGLGKPARSEGVPIFSDLDLVPNSEQVVSFLVRLRYLDPQETAGALGQYVPANQRVAFTPLEKAGTLIITDTASSVRRIVSLLNEIDLPSAPVVEKFVRLERADATKAVEFLNTVFDTKASGTASAGGAGSAPTAPNVSRRPIRRVNEEGQPTVEPVGLNANGLTALSGDSLIQGKITLTADVRTNRVHIVTGPVNMPLVESLLAEYDADTPFAQPIRYPLRFVSAKDVLPILVQTLAEPGSDQANGSGSGTNSSSSSSTGRTNVNSNSTASNSNNSNNPFSSLSGSSSSGSGGSGNSSIGDSQLDTQAVDTTPTIATVGNTKLIADQRSNTIILLGSAEAKDKVKETLAQLDVRAPQVVIRTVIGELSLGNNSELGFNYLLRTNRGSLVSQYNSGFFNNGTTAATGTGVTTGTTTTDPTTGVTTTTPATGMTGSSSTLSTFTDLATGLAATSSSFSGVGGILAIGKSFEIILSALESTNRFKTISRPMIFTSNNKKAIIASGQEIAVPTQSVGSTTGTNNGTAAISTNVDYKDVTLQLEVVPLINSDHEVTLDILQKIDNVVAGSTTVVGGNSVPTIATRYLKSTVSAPNNSTIVLGGLITQDTSKTTGDIPYLSKIPVLGNLFRSRTSGGDRSELIILLHPEVVNTPDLLAKTRENEERRTYLGGDLENQLLPMEVRKALPVKQAAPAKKVKTTTTATYTK